MLVALSTLLRLFAPYLAVRDRRGLVVVAPGTRPPRRWPTADEVLEPIGGADAGYDGRADGQRRIGRRSALHQGEDQEAR